MKKILNKTPFFISWVLIGADLNKTQNDFFEKRGSYLEFGSYLERVLFRMKRVHLYLLAFV